MSYISAAIANLGFAAPNVVSIPTVARPSVRPVPGTEPARDCPEVLRSLTLLRHTHAEISVFQINIDGPAAAEAIPLMRGLLADDGVIEKMADGSYILLIMRFGEEPETVTERLVGTLRICLHRQAARLQATAQYVAIHRSANLIGDAVDLIGELNDYPPVSV